MKYFHINKFETGKPIVVKVSAKLIKIVHRMRKLVREHARLDKEMIKEFARVNGVSEDKASDIMCFHDFLVSFSQYGNDFMSYEISSGEYKSLRGADSVNI